jgi:hypothetical protein
VSDELPSLRIVPPVAIGAAQIVASNVVEVPPAAWASGTTYALNDQRTVFSGVSSTTADVYQSLQAGNLGHVPASSPTWWKWLGRTYAVFIPGGPGGAGYGPSARVIDSSAHLVYESLAVANRAALTDPLSWALVGPTNKYAMFDASNTTQSEAGQSIVVQIAPAGRVDSVALFNLEAASVRIQSTSGYDQTFGLNDPIGSSSFYQWCFQPIRRKKQLVVADLPPWLNQTITVTIANGTGVAAVGNLAVGQMRDLGMPLSDAESGRVDYSKIEVNDWGDYTLTPRRSVKKFSARVVVENARVDYIGDLLDDYRATAVVWIAHDDFRQAQLFGFYRSFSTAFAEHDHSLCSIELEGLT